MIEVGKNNNISLMNDKNEFIPRKYWQDLQTLQGENVAGCYSPCRGLTRSIIQKYFIKHSDTLIIQTCGNKKPYIINPSFNIGKKLMFGGIADFCVCSTETLPIVFSEYYPFRYYDWAHVMEDDFTKDILQQFQFDRIVNFINYFKYKKVIFIKPLKNYITYELEPLTSRLVEFYKHVNDVEFINLIDENSVKQAAEKFNLKDTRKRGILKTRYINIHKYQLYEKLGLSQDFKIKPIYNKEDFIKKENDVLNNNIIVSNYRIPVNIHKLIDKYKNKDSLTLENNINQIKNSVINNEEKEGEQNMTDSKKLNNMQQTMLFIYKTMDNAAFYKKELKTLINEISQKEWSNVYLDNVINACTLNYKKEKRLKYFKNYFVFNEATKTYIKNNNLEKGE